MMREWCKENADVIGVVILAAAMIAAVSWAGYLGGRSRAVRDAQSRAKVAEHRAEYLEHRLSSWESMGETEITAYTYEDVQIEEREVGSLDGYGREVTEAEAVSTTKAVVTIRLWFDTPDDADQWLREHAEVIDVD